MDLLELFDDDVEKARANELGNALELQKEVIDYAPTKLDVFKDILPSLWTTKRYLINEDNEKQYVPFLVNRWMSYHEDNIFMANEMNTHWSLPNKLQYDYYHNAVRAKKRWPSKMIKPIVHPDMAAIKLYFGYSDRQARSALNILTESDLAMIRDATREALEKRKATTVG